MNWTTRLWNVLRSRRLNQDLQRELSFHVREKIDDLVANGLTEKEATRQARRAFGNYTNQVEETRDMDINQYFDSALRNLRLAARSLAKAPGFTASVVLTLALGIGANSAVFSAIFAVLLKPLPFPQSEQLVTLAQTNATSEPTPISPVRLEEWNRMNDTFQAMSGYYAQDDSELSGELPEKMKHAFVAPRILQVFGVMPALGRDFSPAEERFNGPNAILISDRLWRRRFDASPDVLSKKLRIGRALLPIIGVMPANFAFPDRDVDIWSPSPADAPFAQGRRLTWFFGYGRLKPGLTMAQARANLGQVQSNLARLYPDPDAKISPVIAPLKEVTVAGLRRSLWVLFGSVSLLLLIACANVAALLLARATARAHEVSIRYSLGAQRRSVIAQLLTEVGLLAVTGAILGLTLAAAASRVFQSLGKALPRVQEIGLDWRIVLYSLLCATAATLICGIVPAIRGTRTSLAGTMALAGRSQISGRNRAQFVLAGVQVALAVTLLSGAGLLYRSLQELGKVSPGFEVSHILTFHLSTSWAEAYTPQNMRITKRALESLQSMPGVESVTTSIGLPGLPGQTQIEMQDSAGHAGADTKMMADARPVQANYFATMRIPLLAGELCREGDPVPSMMVNRTFATTYYGGTQVIGHMLGQPGNNFVPPSMVRGIVGDAREVGIDRVPGPLLYWCGGGAQPGTYFLLRTHADPASLTEQVRRRVHEVDPLRSVYDVTPLSDHIFDAYAQNRLRTILLSFFAITAIALACVGLYGTLSYMVNLRQRETGLRMALGAMRGKVMRDFLSRGIAVALIGSAAGLAMALASTRLLTGMLYGISANDPLTLETVIAIVVGVSAIASFLPAIRAARLDPMQVLRQD